MATILRALGLVIYFHLFDTASITASFIVRYSAAGLVGVKHMVVVSIVVPATASTTVFGTSLEDL